MKRYLIVLLLAAVALAFGAMQRCSKLKEENKRLTNNQTALIQEVKLYKTKDGKSAAKVVELSLKEREFKQLNSYLKDEVERLGLKIKNLKSATSTITLTSLKIDTVIKDSIVFLPAKGTTDTLKCFSYNDGWINASGCIGADNRFQGTFESNDTISIIAHRVPKRFLFFRWGCKAIEVEVVSHNPHTKINYAKMIEFVRK